MSWIQNIGKYSGYLAKNYVMKHPKDFSHTTLKKEIDVLLKYPKTFVSVINGKNIMPNKVKEHYSPCYNHAHIYNYGVNNNFTQNYFNKNHHKEWKNMSPEKKFEIFENIANLVEGKYFYKMMAATMVGQGKNKLEAELDCIAELVDFLRFNIQYAASIYEKQPLGRDKNINYSQYLPLQGNVCAISPFNFTAIGANLCSAPLYFGNNVIWKPSEKSLLSNHLFYEICLEANIPPEVISFVLMDPEYFTRQIVSKNTGGVLFTGSTDAFKNIIQSVNYDTCFPRIIGETGGKNFHFIEESSNIVNASKKTFESAFNYSGQKCSACSVVYVPENSYYIFENTMKNMSKYFNYENYGLIDNVSYKKTIQTINECKNNENLELIMGGNYNDKKSYFIEPTIFKIKKDENIEIKTKELFAPVLLVKMYEPKNVLQELEECSNLSNYKLTGAFFSNNDELIDYASFLFENSCGNFYINDKSTGSVVGNQPFGGFGMSGTNDKAGDINMLYKLFNQRNIKVGKK